jgi:hypothetical protein
MRQTDQYRFSPVFAPCQASETAVIEAAAHSQSSTLFIKADQW